MIKMFDVWNDELMKLTWEIKQIPGWWHVVWSLLWLHWYEWMTFSFRVEIKDNQKVCCSYFGGLFFKN